MDLHTIVKESAFMKDTMKKVKGQGHIATERTTSLKKILKKIDKVSSGIPLSSSLRVSSPFISYS